MLIRTLDGVTVAKAVTLKDKFENLGARWVFRAYGEYRKLTLCRLIQDVAQKTNEIAGDGTTTATVLARAIYAEGVKNVAAGCNQWISVGVRRQQWKRSSPSLETRQRRSQRAKRLPGATISANGDVHVGSLIAQAMEKVGKEGVITVKEGKTIEDEIEITEGMRFDRGFISPYFITDVKGQKCEMEKPLILLSEGKISVLADILPSLEDCCSGQTAIGHCR